MSLPSKTFGDIITFTRASTGSYFDSAGVLQSAAINAPRFDYDPSTLAARGFLIEESRTNLLTYSAQFNDASWTKNNATITADATTAPDGTLAADKLVETVANAVHDVRKVGVAASALTVYTQSIYLKSAERTKCELQMFGNAGGSTVSVDLSAVTATTVGAYGGWTSASATISAVGNGWYRVTHTVTTNAGLTSLTVFLALRDAAGATTYTGDGTSGMFVWGAQLEAGAFVTSYIPTTTTALTRSADVANVNTLSPWYNAAEGTLFGEVSSAAIAVGGVARRIANINDGTESERITVAWAGATGVAAAFVTDGGVTQASFTSPSGAYPFPTKVALAYKAADFQAAVNGSAFAAVSSGTLPTVNRMTIGDVVTGAVGTQNINGHIRRITYYPRRLSNAELQAITA